MMDHDKPSNSQDQRGEQYPLSEILSEKAFLGTEFLTWLWWRSETSGEVFHVAGIGDVGIQFVKLIQVEMGMGDSVERVSCAGKMAQMREARLGLSTGKKVTRARLIIETGEVTLEATLNAKSLDVQSLKIMSNIDDSFDSDVTLEGKKGIILYKLSFIRAVRHIVQGIFFEYLSKRVDKAAWEMEKRGLRQWIMDQGHFA